MTFSADVEKFVNKFGRNVDQAARRVTFELGKHIVIRSPVDTGRFRANWQHTTGSPSSQILQAADRGGNAAIQKLASSLQASKAGNVEYVVNNLPYGPRLEYEGWSKQAPNGMVRITVAEFRSKMRKIIETLEK